MSNLSRSEHAHRIAKLEAVVAEMKSELLGETAADGPETAKATTVGASTVAPGTADAGTMHARLAKLEADMGGMSNAVRNVVGVLGAVKTHIEKTTGVKIETPAKVEAQKAAVTGATAGVIKAPAASPATVMTAQVHTHDVHQAPGTGQTAGAGHTTPAGPTRVKMVDSLHPAKK